MYCIPNLALLDSGCQSKDSWSISRVGIVKSSGKFCCSFCWAPKAGKSVGSQAFREMCENGGSQQGGGLKTGDLQIAPYCKVQLSQSSSDEHTSLSKIKNNKKKHLEDFCQQGYLTHPGFFVTQVQFEGRRVFSVASSQWHESHGGVQSFGHSGRFCGLSDIRGSHSWRLGSSPGFENMAGPPAWFKLHFSKGKTSW